ncbi:MAG: protein phosphatase 2C domain-containing protein [Ancalomicrobiaceae bacterium]|nr:protein phosphatase 2C domain-containing protein [Ancalomicrobiaceae bacterium]
MHFEFASDQIQGKRAAQEDSLGALILIPANASSGERQRSGRAEELVLVVADGMGGHVGGRIASSLSSQSFLDTVDGTEGDWQERLEQALLAANDALRAQTDTDPDLVGMGSTLVGVILNQNGLGWVSVGDSGLYLCRGGELLRLNEDHSFGFYLDQQARDGIIPQEVAALDRRRNQLFHALLGDPLDHYERFRGFRVLRDGDLILLASDGLKTLSDERIAAILSSEPKALAESLVRGLLAAVEAENFARQDNTSLIVVRVHDPNPEPERTWVPQRAADPPTESPTTKPLRPAEAAAPARVPPPVPEPGGGETPTTRIPPPPPPKSAPSQSPPPLTQAPNPPPPSAQSGAPGRGQGGPAPWSVMPTATPPSAPVPMPTSAPTPAPILAPTPQPARPPAPSRSAHGLLIAGLAVMALAIVAILMWRIWPK